MSTLKKILTQKDITQTHTLIYQAVPITGSIISGTYGTANIENFPHGMFQSVYDYPFLSSSANHIVDLSACYSTASHCSGASSTQNAKKINIYNQDALYFNGVENQKIRRFPHDGDFTGTTTATASQSPKIDEAFLINITRLLSKDEIKKGTFTLELGTSASYDTPFHTRIYLKDSDGANAFKVNSQRGEYGILYASNSAGTPMDGSSSAQGSPAGLLYYQAGHVVLSASVFGSLLSSSIGLDLSMSSDGMKVDTLLTGSSISGACDALRHRIYNLSFNNTTELNTTVYFCRANHNEFNYSTNPTYLTGSKMRVKTFEGDSPLTYVTTVGLYSADNELMAIAKLSEPLRKDPSIEFTIRMATHW